MSDIQKRAYSRARREEMASKGQALPDGSYPIADKADLQNAISAYGRAKDKAAAKAHITRRAKAFGLDEMIPAEWSNVEKVKVPLERVPGKQNWIEHLPAPMRAAWKKSVIHRAAQHMAGKGMPVGIAIASAINWSKHICATGDVKQWRGIQSVRPDNRAEACAAVALWESMKVAAKADNVKKSADVTASEVEIVMKALTSQNVPPQAVRSAAKRGLDELKAGNAGGGLESATVQRARKIAAGEALTDDHVQRMHSFFERHNKTRPSDGGRGPSPWRTAWLLWGGDPGRKWAASVASKLRKDVATGTVRNLMNKDTMTTNDLASTSTEQKGGCHCGGSWIIDGTCSRCGKKKV